MHLRYFISILLLTI